MTDAIESWVNDVLPWGWYRSLWILLIAVCGYRAVWAFGDARFFGGGIGAFYRRRCRWSLAGLAVTLVGLWPVPLTVWAVLALTQRRWSGSTLDEVERWRLRRGLEFDLEDA